MVSWFDLFNNVQIPVQSNMYDIVRAYMIKLMTYCHRMADGHLIFCIDQRNSTILYVCNLVQITMHVLNLLHHLQIPNT